MTDTELQVLPVKTPSGKWRIELIINDCAWHIGDPFENTKEDYDDATDAAEELFNELIEWKDS